MTIVSILGCGWLGFPLGQYLLSKSFSVKGSSTLKEKISKLQQYNILPFLLECSPQISGDQLDSFFDSDILFFNIPFRRDLEDPRYYQQQIDSVIKHVEDSPIQWVIFTGSTSIYPAHGGMVSEEDNLSPDNDRAQVLLDIENSLLANAHFETTIIRFSGLYGGTRDLGRFFSAKQGHQGGGAPVNLIHLDDCVEIIYQIITQNVKGEVLNACSDEHPLKKDLYAKKAKELGIKAPDFINDDRSANKIVLNQKLKKLLNFKFKHPNPLIL